MNKRIDEERFRRRYHKSAHDRRLRDPFWTKLTFEEKGLLDHISCMVATTIEGYDTGILHGEDGRKISVDEFLFLIGGDEDHLRGLLKRLCRARQLDARKYDSGTIKLLHWEADQELPATGDAERKQREASAKLVEEVKEFVPALEQWFATHGKEKVMESDLLSFIKARRGGYEKTRIRFLHFLYDQGVLVQDSSALASLALPPSGVGVGAVSSAVGAGGEIVPAGKFPVDQDQEPDKGFPSGNQLVPVGAGADTRPRLEGGESERSERLRRSDSQPAVPPSREERPIIPPQSVEDCCFEPSDAWRVKDPLQATERILCKTQGWNSVPPRKGVPSDPPLSQHALLSLNHKLRQAHGPKLADQMWRTMLQWLIDEMAERRANRTAPPRCWTAVFSKRLREMSPAEIAGGER